MDLQKTKETRRDPPGKQEEGTGGPLDAYGNSGHSNEFAQNDPDTHSKPGPTANTSKRPQSTAKFSLNRNNPRRISSPRAPRSPGASPPSSRAVGVPRVLGLTFREQKLLLVAKRHPPVTKKTLSELDLPCIMSNINLRMDANFDRDLHFKPDLDGEKGKQKRKEATDYWDALAAEISVYSFCAAEGAEGAVGEKDNGQEEQHRFEPRLPVMFETLQDILKTLVPERDHPSVMQNLEVSLLMQQIRRGVLDMVGVATWLAALLKTHCAPMRDEWADRMVKQIGLALQLQDSRGIVNGLQTLFAVLEAMKLDVANHQIRAFRSFLIDDTVPFLQEYYQSKIDRDHFRVESSRRWYCEHREQLQRRVDKQTTQDSYWPITVMFHGLCESLLQFQKPDEFPETFLFDSDRLWQLRTGLQNLVSLDISWYIFESYIHAQKRYLSAPAETYATFRTRIGSLMEENSEDECGRGPSSRWLKRVRAISLEMGRFASAACCGDAAGVSDEVLSPIEAALEWHLSNESDLFRYFQNAMREKLLAATCALSKKYLPLSPLGICESQRNINYYYPTSTMSQQQYDVERIAMRLAHMGVLHWRVWAPLLYVRESLSPEDVLDLQYARISDCTVN